MKSSHKMQQKATNAARNSFNDSETEKKLSLFKEIDEFFPRLTFLLVFHQERSKTLLNLYQLRRFIYIKMICFSS